MYPAKDNHDDGGDGNQRRRPAPSRNDPNNSTASSNGNDNESVPSNTINDVPPPAPGSSVAPQISLVQMAAATLGGRRRSGTRNNPNDPRRSLALDPNLHNDVPPAAAAAAPLLPHHHHHQRQPPQPPLHAIDRGLMILDAALQSTAVDLASQQPQQPRTTTTYPRIHIAEEPGAEEPGAEEPGAEEPGAEEPEEEEKEEESSSTNDSAAFQ